MKDLKKLAIQLRQIADALDEPVCLDLDDFKEVSRDDVKKAMAEKLNAGKRNAVGEILARHHATKLSDVPPYDYAIMLKELEAI